jgi:drug/metabolite transporter (DMT)-like permease
MIAVLLAAVSACVWGGADYCGGRASRRVDALVVTVGSQILGLPVLALSAYLVPGVWYGTDLLWGAAAGVASLAGNALLYRGLAAGSMAVVAPVSAVTGAVVPMVAGLLTQQAPSASALAGAGCALVSIALVSLGPSGAGRIRPAAVALALGAGSMFGAFFVLLAQTHSGSGVWPLVTVRGVSIALGLLIAASRRTPRTMAGATAWMVGAGAGDIGANALFLMAVRMGLLSVVAPIAALYPVSTVVLALGVDKERVRPVQIAGLGLAATALVLSAV